MVRRLKIGERELREAVGCNGDSSRDSVRNMNDMWKKFYEIGMSMTRGKHDISSDIAQEACIILLRNYGKYDPGRGSNVDNFLGVIGKNAALTFLQKIKRRINRESRSLNEHLAAAEGSQPYEPIFLEERNSLLRGIVESMSERDSGLLRGFYLEGLSYKEIAERDNIPLGTVKSGMHSARGRLEKRLEEIGYLS